MLSSTSFSSCIKCVQCYADVLNVNSSKSYHIVSDRGGLRL